MLFSVSITTHNYTLLYNCCSTTAAIHREGVEMYHCLGIPFNKTVARKRPHLVCSTIDHGAEVTSASTRTLVSLLPVPRTCLLQILQYRCARDRAFWPMKRFRGHLATFSSTRGKPTLEGRSTFFRCCRTITGQRSSIRGLQHR